MVMVMVVGIWFLYGRVLGGQWLLVGGFGTVFYLVSVWLLCVRGLGRVFIVPLWFWGFFKMERCTTNFFKLQPGGKPASELRSQANNSQTFPVVHELYFLQIWIPILWVKNVSTDSNIMHMDETFWYVSLKNEHDHRYQTRLGWGVVTPPPQVN